jgi:sulfonate transport system permease protein
MSSVLKTVQLERTGLPAATAPHRAAAVLARSRSAPIRWSRVAEAAAFPLLLLIVWQAACSVNLVASEILPSPWMVLETLQRLWNNGDLVSHLSISFSRVLQGFFIGGLIGITLGVTMGVSRVAEEMINPTFRAFCQVPTMAWLPLMMLVFGIGETLKIVIITKAVLIPMAINTFEGIRRIPVQYFEVAKVLRLNRRLTLTKLVLPAVLPPMFSGVRQGLSHAWVSLVGVELLASTQGIGYLMSWGRVIFQLDIVFAGVIVVGIVGLAMDIGLRRIESRLGNWQPNPEQEAL